MSHARVHREIVESEPSIFERSRVNEVDAHVAAAFPNDRDETGVHGNVLDDIRPNHRLNYCLKSRFGMITVP